MDEIVELISDIEGYCRQAKISESTFGRQVVNDGKFVSRLRNGKGVTLKTLNKTRAFIRNNSPGPDSIAEKDSVLQLVDAGYGQAKLPPRTPLSPPSVRIETSPESKNKPPSKTHSRRPFRFYENRQKYLFFVHTCNEKWAISQRADREIKHLEPSFPALRVFDAGMGDGTVLSYIMQNLHRRFPTVPLFVNAKEMSVEDVRLGLGKLPDRFVEHPATVFVVSNMAYNEAPWLSPKQKQKVNWHAVPLHGNCAHEYREQIEGLHGILDQGWLTKPSQKTGNPLYETPSVLVLYRADHQFMLDNIIPQAGSINGEYDFILAAQPWQARVSAEFKIKKILAPLARSLAKGGRMLGVQSYGDDPAQEIVQSIWPTENPFTINRHILLKVLKDELGPDARNFSFNSMSDTKSVFRYEMHTLPTEIGEHIGSSTLFAAWNAAIYVNQIQDDQIEGAVKSGQYLEVTREILIKRGSLWFNDETFVVTRKKS